MAISARERRGLRPHMSRGTTTSRRGGRDTPRPRRFLRPGGSPQDTALPPPLAARLRVVLKATLTAAALASLIPWERQSAASGDPAQSASRRRWATASVTGTGSRSHLGVTEPHRGSAAPFPRRERRARRPEPNSGSSSPCIIDNPAVSTAWANSATRSSNRLRGS